MDTQNLKSEWMKAKSALGSKPVGDQIKIMEAFVWEADEQARPKLDQLLQETLDMRETFLSRLAQKLPEQNFVFTEGNVRTLAALNISVEDQRKFVAEVVRSQTKKSIAGAFETEHRTLLGTKEYLDRANKLGQYVQSIEALLKSMENGVANANSELSRVTKGLEGAYVTLEEYQGELKKIRAERDDLEEGRLTQESNLKELENIWEDKKTADIVASISELRSTIIPGIEKQIVKKNTIIGDLEKAESELNALITNLHDAVEARVRVVDIETVRYNQKANEKKDAKGRYEVSVEDLRSMERLSKEVRNSRVTRVQQLYADLIATLPPVSESVDYSQGKGYVLLRMYTILVSSLSEKRNNPEVLTATRELRAYFGFEQTGKIDKPFLDKLESFIAKEQIAYMNTLHIDA